jgi:hypothetical protein
MAPPTTVAAPAAAIADLDAARTFFAGAAGAYVARVLARGDLGVRREDADAGHRVRVARSRPRVLHRSPAYQDAVDVECVEITVAEAVDLNGNVCDELGELRLVIGSHRLARLSAV